MSNKEISINILLEHLPKLLAFEYAIKNKGELNCLQDEILNLKDWLMSEDVTKAQFKSKIKSIAENVSSF